MIFYRNIQSSRRFAATTHQTLIALLLILVLTSLSKSATAKCHASGPIQWYMHSNDKIEMVVTTDQEGCGHSFSRMLNGRELHRIVVMKQPSNGTLKQIGETTYYYIPKMNFLGKDNYVLYICGKELWGSGCARFNFAVTVE
ncbi:hypothetical protein [Bosea lupini]|uniref:hypothetical protein n=1 Tax=Bosea lupini TaxID=1036779 RepID=UPI00116028B6|nr:hypothetical protein [Bosea lupini]